MEHHFNHKFDLGDEVYHITPESDKGIILDVAYYARNKEVKYEVVFGRRAEDSVWCIENELINNKVF